jgi:hypothetical protein
MYADGLKLININMAKVIKFGTVYIINLSHDRNYLFQAKGSGCTCAQAGR